MITMLLLLPFPCDVRKAHLDTLWLNFWTKVMDCFHGFWFG